MTTSKLSAQLPSAWGRHGRRQWSARAHAVRRCPQAPACLRFARARTLGASPQRRATVAIRRCARYRLRTVSQPGSAVTAAAGCDAQSAIFAGYGVCPARIDSEKVFVSCVQRVVDEHRGPADPRLSELRLSPRHQGPLGRQSSRGTCPAAAATERVAAPVPAHVSRGPRLPLRPRRHGLVVTIGSSRQRWRAGFTDGGRLAWTVTRCGRSREVQRAHGGATAATLRAHDTPRWMREAGGGDGSRDARRRASTRDSGGRARRRAHRPSRRGERTPAQCWRHGGQSRRDAHHETRSTRRHRSAEPTHRCARWAAARLRAPQTSLWSMRHVAFAGEVVRRACRDPGYPACPNCGTVHLPWTSPTPANGGQRRHGR